MATLPGYPTERSRAAPASLKARRDLSRLLVGQRKGEAILAGAADPTVRKYLKVIEAEQRPHLTPNARS